MAKGWQELDAGFPTISGEESPKRTIEKVINYLSQVKRGLKVAFQDLEKEIEKLKKENARLVEKIETMQNNQS